MHRFICELPGKEQDGSLGGPCGYNAQARHLGDFDSSPQPAAYARRGVPVPARPICPPSCRSARVLHPAVRHRHRLPRSQSRPPRPVQLPRARQCTCTLRARVVPMPSEPAAAPQLAPPQPVQTCLLRLACILHPLDLPRPRCPTQACIAPEGHFALVKGEAR